MIDSCRTNELQNRAERTSGFPFWVRSANFRCFCASVKRTLGWSSFPEAVAFSSGRRPDHDKCEIDDHTGVLVVASLSALGVVGQNILVGVVRFEWQGLQLVKHYLEVLSICSVSSSVVLAKNKSRSV